MDDRSHAVLELVEVIGREIRTTGPISCARFMELALYHPQLGYYERSVSQTGRRGDYYTSVSVGSLFGELLACQFVRWMKEWSLELGGSSRKPSPVGDDMSGATIDLGDPSGWQIVEAGAHDGRLALDILEWCGRHEAQFLNHLEYVIIEPSPARHRVQAATLAAAPGRVTWRKSWGEIPHRSVRGVAFANELLDALPVHRLGWDASRKTWFEWGVTTGGDGFEWIRLTKPPVTAGDWPDWPGELLAVLPDQFTTEVAPAAEAWWARAAEALQLGRLLTLDYGLSAEQFFMPQRAGGTLRGYHRHHQAPRWLANPGEQDLTADVNFSRLQRTGEAAGLRTEAMVSQAEFLSGIARGTWKAPELFGSWNRARVRQFQTLTHPEHLGRAFRVLIQTCGIQ